MAGAPQRAQVRQDVAAVAEALRQSPVLAALMRLGEIDGSIGSAVEVAVSETVDTNMLAKQLARELNIDSSLREDEEITGRSREAVADKAVSDFKLAHVHQRLKLMIENIRRINEPGSAARGILGPEDTQAILRELEEITTYISGDQHG